jgi:hypothetical protein
MINAKIKVEIKNKVDKALFNGGTGQIMKIMTFVIFFTHAIMFEDTGR